MSRRGGDAFERLLVWYPSRWRAANGEVLLGSLRDHAEHEGRTRPTRSEAASVMVNGVALRLDARVALWASVAALVVTAGAWIPGVGGTWGIATTGAAPVLAVIGMVALMRLRGWIAPPRALIALAALVSALCLAALAQLSWAEGFDLADAGLAPSGLAAAWLPLFIVAWILGSIGLALLLDGALAATRVPTVGRIGISAVTGGLAAPALGIGLINPVMTGVVAAGVAVAALSRLERRDAKAPDAPDALGTRTGSADARRVGRSLAWVGVGGGLAGVAFALTGAQWPFGAADTTAAMGQGITIMLLASIPLFAAVGLGASTRHGRIAVWGPLCVAVLSVFAVAVAYISAPEGEGMAPWMTLSGGLGGGALAWWITPRLRGPLAARVAVGIAAGMAYAADVGPAACQARPPRHRQTAQVDEQLRGGGEQQRHRDEEHRDRSRPQGDEPQGTRSIVDGQRTRHDALERDEQCDADHHQHDRQGPEEDAPARLVTDRGDETDDDRGHNHTPRERTGVAPTRKHGHLPAIEAREPRGHPPNGHRSIIPSAASMSQILQQSGPKPAASGTCRPDSARNAQAGRLTATSR